LNNSKVNYREATFKDAELVFTWANDRLVRLQSFYSTKIDLEHHLVWFKKKIDSTSDLFLIAEINKINTALIRFEGVNHKTVVGILLDKNFRKKGLSSIILQGAMEIYFSRYSKTVTAYIKETNIASKKSFEKVGFKFVKKDKINSIPCLTYSMVKER